MCSFVTSGVIAHRRNPPSRTGTLMVAAGVGNIIAQLQAAPSESVRYMAIWLGGVPTSLLAGLGFLFNSPAAGAERPRMSLSAALNPALAPAASPRQSDSACR